MQPQRKFGALSSSIDPQKLSTTVTGFLLYFTAFFIGLAAKYGIALTDAQIALAAAQIGQAVGILYGLYGLARKILVRSGEKLGYFVR